MYSTFKLSAHTKTEIHPSENVDINWTTLYRNNSVYIECLNNTDQRVFRLKSSRGPERKLIMYFQSTSVKFLLISLIVLVVNVNGYDNVECENSENPLACRGSNILNKVINHITKRSDDTLKLLPGLEIVQNENVNEVKSANDERASKENDTVLVRIQRYLKTHDLKVKFSDLIGKADLQENVNKLFNGVMHDPEVVGKFKTIKKKKLSRLSSPELSFCFVSRLKESNKKAFNWSL